MEWRTNIPIITPNIRLRSVPNELEYLSPLDVRWLSNGMLRNRKHPNLETECEYSPRLIQEPDAFSFHRLSNPNCTRQFVQLTHLHGTPKYNTRAPPFPRAQWPGNKQRGHERDYKFTESPVHVADLLVTNWVPFHPASRITLLGTFENARDRSTGYQTRQRKSR